MAKRIKVAFYVGEWTYAGTARSHFRILEALDRDRFEPYALVWNKGQNDLLPQLERILGGHVIPFRRSLEKTGPEGAYSPISTDLYQVASDIKPDILHHARGGYPEWPLSTYRIAPLQVETNIFGDLDESPNVDKSIAICHYIAKVRGKTDAVIYNPIPGYKVGVDFRDWFPMDAVICGRIGRPGNFDPIAIEAFARVQKERPNLYYMVVAPCPQLSDYVASRRIPNVVAYPATVDDAWIEAFYRTIDIFLHYRVDGEVHSTAIAQAMMYGIPVLSHASAVHNGQTETIAGGGAVVGDVDEYANTLRYWATEPDVLKNLSGYGRKRAEDFEQGKVVKQIEAKYLEWLK